MKELFPANQSMTDIPAEVAELGEGEQEGGELKPGLLSPARLSPCRLGAGSDPSMTPV